MKNKSSTFNSKDIANSFKRLKQDAAAAKTQASDLFPMTSKLLNSRPLLSESSLNQHDASRSRQRTVTVAPSSSGSSAKFTSNDQETDDEDFDYGVLSDDDYDATARRCGQNDEDSVFSSSDTEAESSDEYCQPSTSIGSRQARKCSNRLCSSDHSSSDNAIKQDKAKQQEATKSTKMKEEAYGKLFFIILDMIPVSIVIFTLISINSNHTSEAL